MIPKAVKSREDWDKPKSIPKAVLAGLHRSIKFVKQFSGKIRKKNYVYEALKPGNKIIDKKIEIAGDGNEIYGCYYCVGEEFMYKIIKFDEIQEGEL